MAYRDKAKRLASYRRYREKNREKRNAKNREWTWKYRMKSEYGLAVQDYDDLLAAQGGVCAICKRPDSGTKRTKRLFVDHCHTTGRVRGLLCHKCNLGIGHLPNEGLLSAAALYLKETT